MPTVFAAPYCGIGYGRCVTRGTAWQAIELSAECLANVKFIQEKKLLSKYYDEIAQDTGR